MLAYSSYFLSPGLACRELLIVWRNNDTSLMLTFPITYLVEVLKGAGISVLYVLLPRWAEIQTMIKRETWPQNCFPHDFFFLKYGYSSTRHQSGEKMESDTAKRDHVDFASADGVEPLLIWCEYRNFSVSDFPRSEDKNRFSRISFFLQSRDLVSTGLMLYA